MPHRQQVLLAERLRQRLLRVPGVKKVNILGEQGQRIFVEFSYERLATLGVAPEQLFAALATQNNVVPSGFVETGGPRAYVRVDGAFDTLERIEDVPVAANGRILRIADVATVTRSYEDPPTYRIRHQGRPALMLGVIMERRFSGLELDAALAQEESRIVAGLPLGIRFEKVSDQASKIRAAVGEFMLKFVTALAVVMVISLLALGFRVGLVVGAAVPLTLAIVFVVMLATGREFDRITLGALILSLGLLVDDAIIAIEMMVVKLQEGIGPGRRRNLRLALDRRADADHPPDGRRHRLHLREESAAGRDGALDTRRGLRPRVVHEHLQHDDRHGEAGRRAPRREHGDRRRAATPTCSASSTPRMTSTR